MGIRPFPYLASKMLVLGGLCAVQTALLVALLMLFWEVPGGGAVSLGILLTGFLAALSGVAVGLCVSAAVPTADRAVAMVPLMIPQILFGGAVIPLSSIGPAGSAISTIVGVRWAFEGLARITDRAEFLPVGSPFESVGAGSAAASMLALLLLVLGFGLLALVLVVGPHAVAGEWVSRARKAPLRQGADLSTSQGLRRAEARSLVGDDAGQALTRTTGVLAST